MSSTPSRRAHREQHQKKNTRQWVAAGAAAVILLTGGVIAVNQFSNDGQNNAGTFGQEVPRDCATTQNVTVETTESMAQALRHMPVDPETCISLDISTDKSASDLVAAASSSGGSQTNLWIPDSSLRAELAMAEAGAQLNPVTDSLAQTAGVLVSTKESTDFSHWADVLNDDTAVKMGDPKQDSGAFAALMAGVAEVSDGAATEQTLSEGTALRATTIGVDEAAPSARELLDRVESGEVETAVVTEADYTAYRAQKGDTALKVSAPSSGSEVLNYPMYRTSGSKNATIDNAATQIKDFLASEEGKKALTSAGLRSAGGEALADTNAGPLGAITPLITENSTVLGQTWTSYALQSAPLNALVVLDTSGSMLRTVEGSDKTRIDLTVESVLAGSQLFPARDSMGLWKFSRNLKTPSGEVSDWVELVPLRGFEETVDGKTQRELLQEAGAGIAKDIDPNGKTALNDTLLAAFRSMKESYEPGAANAVIMLTDGENWDDGSISQEELIKTIQAEQDPEHPVFVILIGVSQDADMNALTTIATSVGGEAYPALSPEDIQKIFAEGLTSIAAEKAEGAAQ
ncbi:MAG: substrate-binding domain-containing protein [Rothia sp. (in: high G+C Gram-positive bacteria)]|nr:substrate-binding domain-containing protein [Rothia sp. (in: high G+C Gram-positive bacteria)]